MPAGTAHSTARTAKIHVDVRVAVYGVGIWVYGRLQSVSQGARARPLLDVLVDLLVGVLVDTHWSGVRCVAKSSRTNYSVLHKL